MPRPWGPSCRRVACANAAGLRLGRLFLADLGSQGVDLVQGRDLGLFGKAGAIGLLPIRPAVRDEFSRRNETQPAPPMPEQM